VADAAHPTRARLLDAGLALADERPLAAIAIDDIVRSAQVAKGTFYVHFGDRRAFLVALHERFHDQLREAIAVAARGARPGIERLMASTIAYLDGCLAARGVKAMLASARAEPAIADAVARANDRFARAAAADYRHMGTALPLAMARLHVAMAAEVALLELDRASPDPDLRDALHDFVAGAGARRY
jgi:TetR/AcrR family transcriptional repressor of nem operon